MATNINDAFEEFLADKVRTLKTRSDIAKSSKDNLVKEIAKFPDDGIFPILHPALSIDYGSFSRKTKIQPLDDIDLMIILHGQGCTYLTYADRTEITVHPNAASLMSMRNDYSEILNSRKVINKFKDYLWNVSSYEKADLKRNQEAVTLNLKSYEWVYDIVPCFVANGDYGSDFYLIPDGNGNWKKTDPRIDKNRTVTINAAQKISVLDVIRLFKYWTKRPTMPSMKSYYLENLILNYYNSGKISSTYIDFEFRDLLNHIASQVHYDLNDPKGFQGNINHLTYDERSKISAKAQEDYQKAVDARSFESAGKTSDCFRKWSEIFGPDFPTYS